MNLFANKKEIKEEKEIVNVYRQEAKSERSKFMQSKIDKIGFCAVAISFPLL